MKRKMSLPGVSNGVHRMKTTRQAHERFENEGVLIFVGAPLRSSNRWVG